MLVSYDSLPEDSKVWIFPSSRKFYPDELQLIEEKLASFIADWKSLDKEFKVSYKIKYNRFVVFIADVKEITLTTQDIDVLIGFVISLQTKLNVDLLDKMNVCFKQGEFVQYKDLKEFKALLKNKSVSKKTIVFDNLVETKVEFENYWEVPITESWYNRML